MNPNPHSTRLNRTLDAEAATFGEAVQDAADQLGHRARRALAIEILIRAARRFWSARATAP